MALVTRLLGEGLPGESCMLSDGFPQRRTGFLASNVLVHSVERNGFDQVEVGFIDSVGCFSRFNPAFHG